MRCDAMRCDAVCFLRAFSVVILRAWYLCGKSQANKHPEAARVLGTLAKQHGDSKVFPLRAKQLYVLAALEVPYVCL